MEKILLDNPNDNFPTFQLFGSPWMTFLINYQYSRIAHELENYFLQTLLLHAFTFNCCAAVPSALNLCDYGCFTFRHKESCLVSITMTSYFILDAARL